MKQTAVILFLVVLTLDQAYRCTCCFRPRPPPPPPPGPTSGGGGGGGGCTYCPTEYPNDQRSYKNVLNTPRNGQCATDDYECRCKRLINSLAKLVNLQGIISSCIVKTSYQESTSSASKPETVENMYAQFPENMQNCVVKGAMKELGLLGAGGKIKVSETVVLMASNADKTIADAVTPCAKEVAGQQYMYVAFTKCLEAKCMAEKSAA